MSFYINELPEDFKPNECYNNDAKIYEWDFKSREELKGEPTKPSIKELLIKKPR